MSYLNQTIRRPESLLTPQMRKAEPNQILNAAGGYTFGIDSWALLDRFLILGTEGGTYYASESSLTEKNATNTVKCIQEDGRRVVERILQISASGRAPKQDTALFALALVFAYGNAAAKAMARAILPKVARTGSHLLQFVSYVDSMRGWGRGLKNAVASWYLEKDADQLAYQLTKYANRQGFTQRDVLRLAHPYDETDIQKNNVFRYALGKEISNDEMGMQPELLFVIQQIRKDPTKVRLDLIRDYNLAREVLPTEWLQKPEVWEALLEKMPMTAMIRNLATMTRLGLISERSDATKKIVSELGNADRILKARVHPMAILVASKTYNSGHSTRGSGTWIPSNAIVSALDSAFYLAYGNVEPTNRNTVVALDLSGSMTSAYLTGTVMGIPNFSARAASAAMALIQVNTEPNVEVMGFSTRGHNTPLQIRKDQSLERVIQYLSTLPAGGTDLSQPFQYLHDSGKGNVQSLIIYTDNETWAGHAHPFQALEVYRNKYNVPTRLATVSLTATSNTIVRPEDPLSMDFVGMDSSLPQALNEFLKG